MENISFDKNNSGHPLEVYGDIQRITKIFYWFTGVILASLIFSLVNIFLSDKDPYRAYFILLYIPLILSAFFFIRNQNFEVAAVFLAIVLFLLITLIGTTGLGIHHLSNLGFPTILIVASLVTRKRTMVFLTLFAIGCTAWLVFGELSGAYTPGPLTRSVPGDFFTTVVVLIATAFMVRFLTEALFRSNRQSRKTEKTTGE